MYIYTHKTYIFIRHNFQVNNTPRTRPKGWLRSATQYKTNITSLGQGQLIEYKTNFLLNLL